jgi:hypothetical protein
VVPVTTDVSEEHVASIIRVARTGEVGTALAVINNRNTAFFIVAVVKTSNYTLAPNAPFSKIH